MEAPEVRIRQAWKPVPSPVPYQTPENEPPLMPVVTFDRVADIAREFKRQGVDKAEFCLVGWQPAVPTCSAEFAEPQPNKAECSTIAPQRISAQKSKKWREK